MDRYCNGFCGKNRLQGCPGNHPRFFRTRSVPPKSPGPGLRPQITIVVGPRCRQSLSPPPPPPPLRCRCHLPSAPSSLRPRLPLPIIVAPQAAPGGFAVATSHLRHEERPPAPPAPSASTAMRTHDDGITGELRIEPISSTVRFFSSPLHNLLQIDIFIVP